MHVNCTQCTHSVEGRRALREPIQCCHPPSAPRWCFEGPAGSRNGGREAGSGSGCPTGTPPSFPFSLCVVSTHLAPRRNATQKRRKIKPTPGCVESAASAFPAKGAILRLADTVSRPRPLCDTVMLWRFSIIKSIDDLRAGTHRPPPPGLAPSPPHDTRPPPPTSTHRRP